MIADLRKSLARYLVTTGAVKFGQFRLKLHEKNPTAPLSPIYVDLRVLRSFPDALDAAVEVYKELARGLTFDCYADVPTGATPFVAVLSHETRIPMITPRKDQKGYGSLRPIDGVFKEGQVALLVDDLVSQADSKLEAIAVLTENGLKVHDLIVLIDREQGGVQELEKRGCRCHAAYRLKELLDFYLESQTITQEQYYQTVTYLEGNAGLK